MDNFKAYSQYYDLLYRDKDYAGESAYVAGLLQQYAPGTQKILELGSGSGAHAEKLCTAGYTVTGIERSAGMIAAAKSKAIAGFRPVRGDITDFKLEEQFDAAIALFHVISYVTDNEALIFCFRHTASHLKSEGLFVFDVWFTPAVYTQKPEQRVKHLEDDAIRVVRTAIPLMDHQRNVVDIRFEVTITDKTSGHTETLTEHHPMRHFSIPEIALLAELTGFNVLKAEEFVSGREPGPDTWGVCFILQKQ
jgi:SAM-dependent methyltransferase